MNSLEHSLLSRMFLGDLDIAKRMLEIGDLHMAQSALDSAATKLRQIRSLPVAPTISDQTPKGFESRRSLAPEGSQPTIDLGPVYVTPTKP